MFIDHQPQMTLGVAKTDRATLINNVTLLAKVAKEFNVLTVLTRHRDRRLLRLCRPMFIDVFLGQLI